MAAIFRAPIDPPEFDFRAGHDVWERQEKEYIAQLAEIARHRGGNDPLIGRVAKFQIADGYAQYMVAKVRPLELWHLALLDGYSISPAHARGLRLADIRANVGFEDAWAKLADDHDSYFASLPIGSIVHYDEGFGKFVRCVRVEGERGHRLKPIALVGNWDAYDLPRRNPDGSVGYSSGGRLMEPGFTFEPNYSSIWERYDAEKREWSMRGLTAAGTAHLNEIGRARFAQKRYQAPFDPTTAEPIDLTLPEATAEEQALAVYAQRLQRIAAAASETPRTLDEARKAYRNVRALVVPDFELPERITAE